MNTIGGTKAPSHSEKGGHEEELSHPFGNWLLAHRYALLYTTTALVLIILFVLKYTSSHQIAAETDYMVAENHYAAKSFEPLSEILNRREELHAKYDGLLCQEFLKQGEAEKAEVTATAIFTRLEQGKEYSTLFLDYSRASLLIETGRLEEALVSAQALDQKLAVAVSDEERSYQHLKAFNTLRIVMLSQELGRSEIEREAVASLQSQIAEDGSSSMAPTLRDQLVSHFQEGNVTLEQYLQYRAKALLVTESTVESAVKV